MEGLHGVKCLVQMSLQEGLFCCEVVGVHHVSLSSLPVAVVAMHIGLLECHCT